MTVNVVGVEVNIPSDAVRVTVTTAVVVMPVGGVKVMVRDVPEPEMAMLDVGRLTKSLETTLTPSVEGSDSASPTVKPAGTEACPETAV